MKIKCPLFIWCKVEVETEKDLGNHLFSKHAHDEVCWTLADKIFKIHEKISEHKKLHFNNYIIEQLESLLENEK